MQAIAADNSRGWPRCAAGIVVRPKNFPRCLPQSARNRRRHIASRGTPMNRVDMLLAGSAECCRRVKSGGDRP
jgi:hypothetical protein